MAKIVARIPWLKLVGELLIIILGILIALAADRWNEQRLERDLERHYLHSLKADLASDRQSLAELSFLTQKRVAAATKFLSELGEDPTQPEAMLAYNSEAWFGGVDSLAREMPIDTVVDWTGRVFPFESTSPTFDELTSTGNLRILRNPDLRRGLSEYYRSIAYSRFIEEEQGEVLWNGYHVLMGDHGVAVWDWPGTAEQLKQTISVIPALGAMVRRARMSFYVQDFFMQPIGEEAEALIPLIDGELAKY